jgi:acyl carrier protein
MTGESKVVYSYGSWATPKGVYFGRGGYNLIAPSHHRKLSMSASRDEVQTFVEKTLEDLARDWDLASALSSDSKLFSELGLESLDAVILATTIQEKYGTTMPFAELFAEIGQQQRDLTVAELVDFTWKSLQA